jgi:hypothetical protein
LALIGLAFWAAAASAADVKVDYDKDADFSRYKSWSWRPGTPAPNPVADKRLREAIESRLAARGLGLVERAGDLEVVYHAAGENRIGVEKLGYKEPGFENEATRVRYVRVGTVMIDMIDAASRKVVWRGQAQDIANPAPHDIERMINEGMDELFQHFPPKR